MKRARKEEPEQWVPPTEGVKYIGSKLRMLPYIVRIVSDLPGIRTVLDGFSGTTRVSQAFYQLGYEVTCNDVAVWSEVFGRCYLQADRPQAYYQELIAHLNALSPREGWFARTYGPMPKSPFQYSNLCKLDAVREEITSLRLDAYDESVLLTSLMLALNNVDSTLGHFSSYLSKWSQRSYRELFLPLPRLLNFSLPRKQSEVLRGDVFQAIEGRRFDLAYFDPPYGSNNEKMPPSRVRYAAYYHFWTSVVLNDHPQVFGRVARRADTRDLLCSSPFEEYRSDSEGRHLAMKTLSELVARTDARYILLSYSSGGRVTKQELLELLEANGRLLQVLEVDYRKNVMAQMKWTNSWASADVGHQEYLFLIEKN